MTDYDEAGRALRRGESFSRVAERIDGRLGNVAGAQAKQRARITALEDRVQQVHELASAVARDYTKGKMTAKALRDGPRSYDKRIADLDARLMRLAGTVDELIGSARSAEVRAETTARQIDVLGGRANEALERTDGHADKMARIDGELHELMERVSKVAAALDDRIEAQADIRRNGDNMAARAIADLDKRVAALESGDADECSCETVDECDGSCTAAERAMWSGIYSEEPEFDEITGCRQASGDESTARRFNPDTLRAAIRAEYRECVSAGMTRIEAVNRVSLRARQFEVAIMAAAVEIAEEVL